MNVVNFLDVPLEDSDAAEAPRALSLDRFCRDVGRIVETCPLAEVPAKVAALLPRLLDQPDLLTPAQREAPADAYGRNTVFLCPQDKFSVLAMVWPAGVSTPIHDHRDWCALGVYEGVIEETRYSPATADPDCTAAIADRTVRHRPGAVAHLPVNGPNIHKIHNPTDEVAISLHIYGGNSEDLGPNLNRIYALA